MQVGRHIHARRCSPSDQIGQTTICPIVAAQLHIHPLHNTVQNNAKPRQRYHAVVAAQRTALATDDADRPEDFPFQALTNFSSGQGRRAASKIPPGRKLSLSLLQLGTVIALLIIAPAWWFCKCVTPRVWAAAAIYCVFFGFGGIRRTLKYGKLSSRKQDAQVSTWQGKWAIATFVLMVIAGHWGALHWYGTCYKQLALHRILRRPVIQCLSVILLCGALALHIWATETLGKAYDRLVVPDKLVKTGPYAWCQHPIYTSYMLLFSGFTLLFGSEEWCCLLLYVCWRYYKRRTDAEANMLQDAFGNEYKVYQEHIGKFVPKVV